MCELDLACFLSVPGLAWQGCLKKPAVELELLTDANMLLMVAKDIRGVMCHAIHQYAKANNKYIMDYDPSKESSYLMYWDVKDFYGWAMSQKVHVDGSKSRKDLFRFNEEL